MSTGSQTPTATLTPIATAPVDSDGDGIPDADEGSGDRDGDGRPDDQDFDPTGYLYDEATGRILTGARIGVSGPGPVTLLADGSTGFYRFTASVAGVYVLTIEQWPAGYVASATCLPQDPPPLDPSGAPNPLVLGNGEFGDSGFLAGTAAFGPPNACTGFTRSFALEPGDPLVIDNNVPLRRLPHAAPVFSMGGWVAALLALGGAGLFGFARRGVPAGRMR